MVNPAYRNNRRNYYQEKGPDTVTIGTVVNVFKTKQNSNSYDSNFVPSTLPINGVTAYTDLSGNGQPEVIQSINTMDIFTVMEQSIISLTIRYYMSKLVMNLVAPQVMVLILLMVVATTIVALM